MEARFCQLKREFPANAISRACDDSPSTLLRAKLPELEDI